MFLFVIGCFSYIGLCVLFSLSALATDLFLLVWYALSCSVCVCACANSPSSMPELRLYYNNTVDRIELPFSNSFIHFKNTPGHSHMYAWSLWWYQVKWTCVVWSCDVLAVGCLFTSFQNIYRIHLLKCFHWCDIKQEYSSEAFAKALHDLKHITKAKSHCTIVLFI